MASISFDDLIPQGAGAIRFDDLIPEKPGVQGPPIPADYKPPATPGTGGALAASSTGLRQGLTFGLGDEIMAGMLTPVEMAKRAYTGEDAGKGIGERLSEAYSANLDRERGIMREQRENHPVANAVGEVAGGVATGGQLAKGGATLLKGAQTYPNMIGRGAAEGAAYGAAHGFGSGEGVEDRLQQARSGALIGGAAGGALGAVGARMANSNALKAVPAADELKAEAQALYRQADAAGLVVKPQPFSTAVNDITQTVIKEGIDPTLHPSAMAALDRLQKARGVPLSLSELDTLRQVVNDAAASNTPGERRLASIMRDKLDGFLAGLQPTDVAAGNAQQATEAIAQARDLWSRFRKGELIERMGEKAENSAPNFSGSGYENALRTRYRQLANNDRAMRQFSPEEQAAIERVARGGSVENTLRMLGKFAPTGVVSSGFSGGLGYTLGGPVGAVAVPALGMAARQGATAMTSRNAQLADALIRSGGNIPKPQLSGSQRVLIELLSRESGQGPSVNR